MQWIVWPGVSNGDQAVSLHASSSAFFSPPLSSLTNINLSAKKQRLQYLHTTCNEEFNLSPPAIRLLRANGEASFALDFFCFFLRQGKKENIKIISQMIYYSKDPKTILIKLLTAPLSIHRTTTTISFSSST